MHVCSDEKISVDVNKTQDQYSIVVKDSYPKLSKLNFFPFLGPKCSEACNAPATAVTPFPHW